MTNELVDLDAVVAEDVGIRWNDTVYLLPGDIEGEMVAKLIYLSARAKVLGDKAGGGKITSKEQKELQAVSEEFHERFEALFRIRQPDLPKDFLDSMTRTQVKVLVQQVLAYYLDVPVPEGGDRPTRTQPRRRSSRRSPRRSSAKARKASASSTSSPT